MKTTSDLKGGLKTGLQKLFVVQNIWYSNVQPSHVTLTFEYQTPILSGIQMNPVLGVRYSDGYCIQIPTQAHCNCFGTQLALAGPRLNVNVVKTTNKKVT